MTDHTAHDLVGEIEQGIMEWYGDPYMTREAFFRENSDFTDLRDTLAARLAARFGIFSKPEKNPYLVGEIEEILDSQCRVVKVDGWNEINCIDDQRTWEVAKVLAARFGQRTVSLEQLSVIVLGALVDHEQLRETLDDYPDEDVFIATRILSTVALQIPAPRGSQSAEGAQPKKPWNHPDNLMKIDTHELAEIARKKSESRSTISSPADAPQAADRWIPVSERLPEEDGSYLVWAPRSFPKNARFMAAEYYSDNKTFYDEGHGEHALDDVTHWMPIPAPPKEEK